MHTLCIVNGIAAGLLGERVAEDIVKGEIVRNVLHLQMTRTHRTRAMCERKHMYNNNNHKIFMHTKPTGLMCMASAERKKTHQRNDEKVIIWIDLAAYVLRLLLQVVVSHFLLLLFILLSLSHQMKWANELVQRRSSHSPSLGWSKAHPNGICINCEFVV